MPLNYVVLKLYAKIAQRTLKTADLLGPTPEFIIQ